MEEEPAGSKASKLLCLKLPQKNQWIWLYTMVPSALSFLLHLATLVVDTTLASCLLMADKLLKTGVITFIFIYIPVIFNLVLSPPQLPRTYSLRVVASWLLQVLGITLVTPIFFSLSLMKHFLWTLAAVQANKPYEDIFKDYETVLPRETHSYLFLQAFLHCAPQAVLQIHLLLLGIPATKYTAYLQGMSALLALIKIASCAASYHRYEAQLAGGRPSILFLPPPEHSTDQDTSTALLPIRMCIQSKIIAVEMDCSLGKVVAFWSWLLLIFGRILCLVLSNEVHPSVTTITLFGHFFIILLYLLSSQLTTLSDIPSRIINALFSLITLVEVSVRFHMMPLLYTLFFISIFVEDTYLMILFFIYPSKDCSSNKLLSCSHFSLYTYLIMNSHVIGIILFGIYLAKLRPRRTSLVTSQSTTSIITSE